MSTIINRPVLKEKYDNYINGKWTAPSTGQYFEVLSP
jgi:aldehyde dehydrogenase